MPRRKKSPSPTPDTHPLPDCLTGKSPHLYTSGTLTVQCLLPDGSFAGWVLQSCSRCDNKHITLI